MTTNSYKQLSTLLLAYFFLLLGFYIVFYFLGLIDFWPSNNNVAAWDANWYLSIKKYGYYYNENIQTNSGFFPLFPYLWRILHFNNIGICVFNFILFGISFIFLVKNLEIKWEASILFLSFPSSIFFILPFSESLFFCCSAVFLIGIKKEDYKLIILGILLASITRATATFFIPAFIAMELLYNRQGLSKKKFLNIAIFSVIACLGMAIVVAVQYYQTGVMFAFAKQQFRFWGHELGMPGLPLVTWDNARLLWLDGMGVITGIIALFILSYLFIIFLAKKTNLTNTLFNNKAYIFSTAFCVMTLMYVLFFNQKTPEGSTPLFSLNRYMFSSAFFVVFFSGTLGVFQLNKKSFVILTVILFMLFLCMGLGTNLPGLSLLFHYKYKTVMYFLFIYVYVLMAYSFSLKYQYKRELLAVMFVLNIILQVVMINTIIQGKWVA